MEKGISDQSGNVRGAHGEDELASLFRHASARPEPSDVSRTMVEEAVRTEWLAVTGRRRRWRRAAGISLAAAALVAAMLPLIHRGPGPGGTELREMARVGRVTGQVRVFAEQFSGPGAPTARQLPIYVGQSLRTESESGISLRLAGGISLRVDEDSKLVMVDEQTVKLERGRLYVATEPKGPAAGDRNSPAQRLEVVTERGAIRHLGTQYMVYFGSQALRVNVREGVVQVRSPGDSGSVPVYVPDGQQLSIDAFGARQLSPGDTHGERWQWVESLGPGFALDGHTMAEFLEWVADETGYEIVYESEQARSVAEEAVLHGEVDLPARDALEVVVKTSDLAAEFRDGAIQVSIKP